MGMPSPRASPAMRPQSPLSSRFEPSARFDQRRPPSPRNMHGRTGNSQRLANTTTLKLPSLPRFHPANFPSSSHGSAQPSPEANVLGLPPPPLSPRGHHRVYSDAQKHLLAYQHEMISFAVRTASPSQLDKPVGPRLAPMGSPGPVTPLELEADGGYLIAGSRGSGGEQVPSDELVERLIREEADRRRMGNNSPRPKSR